MSLAHGQTGSQSSGAFSRIAVLVPAAMVLFLTVLCAVPLGMPMSQEMRLLLPLAPYAAIHYWHDRQSQLVPAWLVFAAGFATDVLTNGPLGYWALVYLVGFGLGAFLHDSSPGGAFWRWLMFAATIIVLAVVEWTIASLYFVGWSDWRPFAVAALAITAIYPLLALAMQPLERLWARPGNDLLARGG